jgi:hypothetical protein
METSVPLMFEVPSCWGGCKNPEGSIAFGVWGSDTYGVETAPERPPILIRKSPLYTVARSIDPYCPARLLVKLPLRYSLPGRLVVDAGHRQDIGVGSPFWGGRRAVRFDSRCYESHRGVRIE